MTVKKKVTKKKATKKKVSKKATNKVGRPTKYEPKYCEMLIEHMSKGFSYETFGATIDVARSTVYEWEKNKEFSDAKKRAFDKCQLFWEQAGNSGMYLGKSFVAPVWIFNMKNRFNWTDKQEIDHGNKDNESFKFAFDLSEEPKD